MLQQRGCGSVRTNIAELPAPDFNPRLGDYALGAGDSVITGSGFSRQRGGAPCDIDGRFEFAGIPSGSYIVVTVITWLVPGSGQQGGPVFQRVRVDGDESLDVTLTNVS